MSIYLNNSSTFNFKDYYNTNTSVKNIWFKAGVGIGGGEIKNYSTQPMKGREADASIAKYHFGLEYDFGEIKSGYTFSFDGINSGGSQIYMHDLLIKYPVFYYEGSAYDKKYYIDNNWLINLGASIGTRQEYFSKDDDVYSVEKDYKLVDKIRHFTLCLNLNITSTIHGGPSLYGDLGIMSLYNDHNLKYSGIGFYLKAGIML